MHQPVKSLSLITVTVLLSLVSPISLKVTSLKISEVPVQAQTTQNRKAEADRLLQQGLQQQSASQMEAAIQSLQQALIIYKELQDRQGEGLALAFLGDTYAVMNENQKAIEFAQQALTLARETKNSGTEAVALDSLTRAYSSLGDAQKTVEFAQQALAVARQIKNKLVEVRALAFIGNAYASLKEHQKAIEFAQQALTLARETKNSGAEAVALDSLTRAYSSLGDGQKTIEFGQQALVVARQIKNNLVEGRALAFLGSGYIQLKEPQKGIDFAQQTKNSQLEALSTFLLSLGYFQLENYTKTVEFAQKSLALGQSINPEFKQTASIALAIAYLKLNQEQNTINTLQSLFESGEVKGRKLTSYEAKKYAEFTLSLFYMKLDRWQEAIDMIERGLADTQDTVNQEVKLPGLSLLSFIYIYLGDYKKGTELAQQGILIGKTSQNKEAKALLFASLVLAALQQGDYQNTIDAAQKILKSASDNKDTNLELFALYMLAQSYGGLGDYQKARQFAQQSLALSQERKVAQDDKTLAILANIDTKEGRTEEAILKYRKLIGTNNKNLNAQISLARIYRTQNLPTTAITYYKQAVSQIEQERISLQSLSIDLQESLLKNAVFGFLDKIKRADVYRELADLLIAQGRVGEAQQVLELLKVQELNDFARGTRSPDKISDVELNAVETRIRDKHGSLIAFGKKLAECEQSQDAKPCSQLSELQTQYNVLAQKFDQEVQTIEKQVAARRLEQVTTGTQDFIASAEKIVSAQPNTVLIYPLVLQDRVRLLWASKGGVLSNQVCNVGETELWKTISEFRELLRTPRSDIATVKATGKKLYDCLVKPLEPELQKNNIQNLVFVPDRSTSYIPMGALFDGEKFLIERYTISSVLNAGLTDVSDRLPPNPQNTPVLALGLSEAKAGFNALPNVPLELDAIVRQQTNDSRGIYPGAEFLNQSFTLDALQNNLRDRKVLHIATHGVFVPKNPKESYLLLGNGDKYPIYQIQFLRNLRNVHLVVLSACETALGGPDANGTEIPGISSYFLRDKAKAVMASLWSVNDDSTRQLMQNFYSNLATAKATAPITKAQALRQAQLNLLRGSSSIPDNPEQRGLGLEDRPGSASSPLSSTAPGFSHPYYWAPFILIGNSL
jgi:CHAT domain-containing protein/lipopolysaccharide biosynthesis regulator YciM